MTGLSTAVAAAQERQRRPAWKSRPGLRPFEPASASGAFTSSKLYIPGTIDRSAAAPTAPVNAGITDVRIPRL